MAEDGDIDIEGDFDFKLEVANIYDTNELPSKSANLLPEYTNPAWMLEQGWTMDSCIDEKSKATIEKMLQEEQYYLNGKVGTRQRLDKIAGSSKSKPMSHKQPWSEEEKQVFQSGLEIFGRSWSKIAQLIPSRTTLQVKNYAQQYFKQQAKRSPGVVETSTQSQLDPTLLHNSALAHVLVSVTTGQPTVTTATAIRPQVTLSRSHMVPHPRPTCTAPSPSVVSNPSLPVCPPCPVPPIPNTATSSSQGLAFKPIDRGTSSTSTMKIITQTSPRLVLPKRPASAPKLSQPVTIITTNLESISGAETPKQFVYNGEIQLLEVTKPANQLQLSPTLENKLASSTGIIENLDGFCAVADIIPGSSSMEDTSQDDEEIDIDIENDDENDENPILKSRSASPNSVYERLLKAANIRNKDSSQKEAEVKVKSSYKSESVALSENKPPVKSPVKCEVVEESCEISEMPVVSSDVTVLESGQTGQLEVKPLDAVENTSVTSEVISESSEDWSTESNYGDEKKISNSIILSNGEVVEFSIPTEEHVVDYKSITDVERKIHIEFFDGRPSKTPERYMKIRNYILESWRKCRPNYLNKTSVRPGLRNCGDVNCIGRIHSYLECTGAINFGCDQACYNHPTKIVVAGPRERFSREAVIQVNLSKLEAMRPRKRRIRDACGHWVDEKELQGKTIEHKEGCDEGYPKPKAYRFAKGGYDPFQLIPCVPFSEDLQPPFSVEVYNLAMITMDMHAHVSKTEVIGMLGGQYMEEQGKLVITMAVPCNSISTGMQCEMDPVSQTLASEAICQNYSVVGWYHSHPTFAPNPSIRDIETQLKFQEWFSKGGSKFVGVIVSPYNRQNPSLYSEFQCLTIGQERSETDQYNIPNNFSYDVIVHPVPAIDLKAEASDLAERYASYTNRVELLGDYRVVTQIRCLDKMLLSISEYMDNSQDEVEDLTSVVRDVFTEAFSSNHPESVEPDVVCEDSDYFCTEADMMSSSSDSEGQSQDKDQSESSSQSSGSQSKNVLQETDGAGLTQELELSNSTGPHLIGVS
ncbi:histone H2A deubiquitinase MYSM1-like [Mizuhopecten yessoensis]|uniref:Myb-like, SWIRM and MPN domain-containing protein 1 n=1 Tax=Mizuhopecten yessoensis TaxID=6573 RepID=A0A210PNP9_MIZYE|nr:histone H2A deubiquitinase MYSM1-like [Mizuhopecten yessoensis]OWF38111.1 Histone H2A deubiquitinase MYSM1 [Mizuhopecten yessoensis]